MGMAHARMPAELTPQSGMTLTVPTAWTRVRAARVPVRECGSPCGSLCCLLSSLLVLEGFRRVLGDSCYGAGRRAAAVAERGSAGVSKALSFAVSQNCARQLLTTSVRYWFGAQG